MRPAGGLLPLLPIEPDGDRPVHPGRRLGRSTGRWVRDGRNHGPRPAQGPVRGGGAPAGLQPVRPLRPAPGGPGGLRCGALPAVRRGAHHPRGVPDALVPLADRRGHRAGADVLVLPLGRRPGTAVGGAGTGAGAPVQHGRLGGGPGPGPGTAPSALRTHRAAELRSVSLPEPDRSAPGGSGRRRGRRRGRGNGRRRGGRRAHPHRLRHPHTHRAGPGPAPRQGHARHRSGLRAHHRRGHRPRPAGTGPGRGAMARQPERRCRRTALRPAIRPLAAAQTLCDAAPRPCRGRGAAGLRPPPVPAARAHRAVHRRLGRPRRHRPVRPRHPCGASALRACGVPATAPAGTRPLRRPGLRHQGSEEGP